MSEGKEGDTIDKVIGFFSSPDLQGLLENFLSEKAGAFDDAVRTGEEKEGELEHKLEYKEIHEQYLKLFEGHLEGFLEKEGVSTEAFYKECADLQETGAGKSWFVDMLLSAMDYKYFFGLMVNGEWSRRCWRCLCCCHIAAHA